MHSLCLFAVSLYAQRQVQRSLESVHSAGAVLAISETEASTKAMTLCRQRFPVSEQWHAHNVTVTVIPSNIIQQVR